MRTHENLEVWKKSIDLVVEIHTLTNSFPIEEKFGLTSQIRRASVSIPSNIAEGAARNSVKEFLHFLSNSQGSTSEVSTQILLAFRLGLLKEKNYHYLSDKIDEIGRMITGLRNHLRKKNN
jgi:four helix bundle protein